MISVVRMDGTTILDDVVLADLRTIGSLQRRVEQRLNWKNVVLVREALILSAPNTLAEGVLMPGDQIVAIIKTSRTQATAPIGAFAFRKQDGSVVTWGDRKWCRNFENVKEAFTKKECLRYAPPSVRWLL